jgi:Family of unknown function (DUF6225)
MPTIRYTHTPEPQLTVGQLRAALDGIPDDRPVHVRYSDGHPRRGIVEFQQVTGAGFMTSTRPDGTEVADHSFTVFADFEAGDYEYWTDEDEG